MTKSWTPETWVWLLYSTAEKKNKTDATPAKFMETPTPHLHKQC